MKLQVRGTEENRNMLKYRKRRKRMRGGLGGGERVRIRLTKEMMGE
jgi:hypothetical protein